MARFRCSVCGNIFPNVNTPCQTEGCPGGRDTYVKVNEGAGQGRHAPSAGRAADRSRLVALGSVTPGERERVATGIAEFDRVTGGGLVTGSLVLLAGDPGIGKSTLLGQVVDALVKRGHDAIYASGEESAGQIRLRAERLGLGLDMMRVLAETDATVVAATIAAEKPRFAVVDSIQTMYVPSSEGVAGNQAQVREVAMLLLRTAKETGTSLILIGHVNKDGHAAGPETLQHLVDAVFMLEGDKHGSFRILRATKNRFGATDEIGLFEMREEGMIGVDGAATLLVEGGEHFGRVVCPVLEGARSLLVEVQALVNQASYSSPRRIAVGVPEKRVAMLLAVLERYADIDLSGHDVYVQIGSGVAVNEPAVDAAICAAIASSYWSYAVDRSSVVLGEVSLNGGLRPVRAIASRLKETVRLGFTDSYGPVLNDALPQGITHHDANEIVGLLKKLDVLKPAGVTPAKGRKQVPAWFRGTKVGERDDADEAA